MINNKLNYIGLTVTRDLFVSIIDKGPFYNFSSPSSHVPSQYLYAGINCLTFRALSYTDKDSSLQNELHKIQQSAIKAGLPEDKVSKILSSRKIAFNCDKSNCDNVSNMSESDNTDSKRFVLLPFINAKLANLLHNKIVY